MGKGEHQALFPAFAEFEASRRLQVSYTGRQVFEFYFRKNNRAIFDLGPDNSAGLFQLPQNESQVLLPYFDPLHIQAPSMIKVYLKRKRNIRWSQSSLQTD